MLPVFVIQKKHTKLILLSILFLFFGRVQSQNDYSSVVQIPEGGYRVTATVDGKDTIPYIWLNWVYVMDKMSPMARLKMAQWNRLRYNVKKLYPFAIMAAAEIREINNEMAKLPTEHKRKAFLKEREKNLQKEFGPELKELSISQGKILMKLIDRETGKSTYDIVKHMRGGFNAFVWQSVFVMCGTSMKQEYDLKNPDDQQIELAVRQVESGQY